MLSALCENVRTQCRTRIGPKHGLRTASSLALSSRHAAVLATKHRVTCAHCHCRGFLLPVAFLACRHGKRNSMGEQANSVAQSSISHPQVLILCLLPCLHHITYANLKLGIVYDPRIAWAALLRSAGMRFSTRLAHLQLNFEVVTCRTNLPFLVV